MKQIQHNIIHKIERTFTSVKIGFDLFIKLLKKCLELRKKIIKVIIVIVFIKTYLFLEEFYLKYIYKILLIKI